ncbi:alpha/beta hydrolase, partial [Streptomyces sp. SID4931]
MRRTTVLGSAGALVAGTLIAGAMAAPAASADGRHHGRGDAEARGVAVAAQRAA